MRAASRSQSLASSSAVCDPVAPVTSLAYASRPDLPPDPLGILDEVSLQPPPLRSPAAAASGGPCGADEITEARLLRLIGDDADGGGEVAAEDEAEEKDDEEAEEEANEEGEADGGTGADARATTPEPTRAGPHRPALTNFAATATSAQLAPYTGAPRAASRGLAATAPTVQQSQRHPALVPQPTYAHPSSSKGGGGTCEDDDERRADRQRFAFPAAPLYLRLRAALDEVTSADEESGAGKASAGGGTRESTMALPHGDEDRDGTLRRDGHARFGRPEGAASDEEADSTTTASNSSANLDNGSTGRTGGDNDGEAEAGCRDEGNGEEGADIEPEDGSMPECGAVFLGAAVAALAGNILSAAAVRKGEEAGSSDIPSTCAADGGLYRPGMPGTAADDAVAAALAGGEALTAVAAVATRSLSPLSLTAPVTATAAPKLARADGASTRHYPRALIDSAALLATLHEIMGWTVDGWVDSSDRGTIAAGAGATGSAEAGQNVGETALGKGDTKAEASSQEDGNRPH